MTVAHCYFLIVFYHKESPDVPANLKDVQEQTGWKKYISMKKKLVENTIHLENIESVVRFHDKHFLQFVITQGISCLHSMF